MRHLIHSSISNSRMKCLASCLFRGNSFNFALAKLLSKTSVYDRGRWSCPVFSLAVLWMSFILCIFLVFQPCRASVHWPAEVLSPLGVVGRVHPSHLSSLSAMWFFLQFQHRKTRHLLEHVIIHSEQFFQHFRLIKNKPTLTFAIHKLSAIIRNSQKRMCAVKEQGFSTARGKKNSSERVFGHHRTPTATTGQHI